MKNFMLVKSISLKQFYKYIYMTVSIIIASIFLIEWLMVKLSGSMSGYFPVLSFFFAPVLAWVITQIQFFRYRKLFKNQGRFKLMWILAVIPFTFPYVYIAVALLPLLAISLVVLVMNLFIPVDVGIL